MVYAYGAENPKSPAQDAEITQHALTAMGATCVEELSMRLRGEKAEGDGIRRS